MRRSLIALVLGLLAFGALTGPAAAKEMSAELAAGPPTLGPGDPWNAQLVVHGDRALQQELAGGNIEISPSVVIRNLDSGKEVVFPAKPVGKGFVRGEGRFQARVVFPSAGDWAIGGTDGLSDRVYDFGAITIRGNTTAGAGSDSRPASPAAAPVGSDGGGGFPVWAALVGAIALLAGVGGIAYRTLRRPRLEPTA